MPGGSSIGNWRGIRKRRQPKQRLLDQGPLRRPPQFALYRAIQLDTRYLFRYIETATGEPHRADDDEQSLPPP